MENVLFKISFPAEFHAQTAVEAAMTLHPEVRDRLDDINEIVIETQEPGLRIIDKTGPLDNPADRDHCIQYMTAIPLLFGRLVAADYEDAVARDPRVDALRDRMTVRENEDFTRDYYDPEKRYIGNAVQVFFNDGTATGARGGGYPIGHRKRRAEGIPVLVRKFEHSVRGRLSGAAVRGAELAVRRPAPARRDAGGRVHGAAGQQRRVGPGEPGRTEAVEPTVRGAPRGRRTQWRTLCKSGS
jgi:2-methylcitrate dehydratase